MTDKEQELLAPFDDKTQELLIELDTACGIQMDNIKKDVKKAELYGNEFELDLETMVWMKFIKGYGILMNRAIDAGWVKGIHRGDRTY